MSLPQNGAWALSTSPASESQDQEASSASSSVDSRGSSSNPGASSAAVTAADGESVTSNSACSLCAARLASIERQKLEGSDGSQSEGAHCDDETEGSGGTADTGTFDCTQMVASSVIIIASPALPL